MSKEVVFSPDYMARFEALVKKYESRRSALLPTMWLAQEQFGFLSNEVLEYIAKLIDIPPREVFEAATFYVMFKKKDMGRWCLQVCNNITCTLMGAEKLNAVIKETLGIGPNEVSADGEFSFVPVQCLGSCDTAPVVQVNEAYVENLDAAKFKSLLLDLKEGRKKISLEGV